MTDTVTIDGHTRRFQLLVIGLAAVTILIAAIAIGSVASDSIDHGIGSGDGIEFDIEGPEGDMPGGENGEETADTDSTDTDSPGDSGGRGVEQNDGDGRTDILNAFDDTAQFIQDRDQTPYDDQRSRDSFRSFVNDTDFTVDTDTPRFWRVTSYDYSTPREFHQSYGTDDLMPVGERMQQHGDGEVETREFTLERDSSRLPVASHPTNVEITGGVDPSAYNFKQLRDGTVVVTDTNGEITELPEGTQYTVESIPPAQYSDELATSGDTYPRDIEAHYTRPSDSSPDRVGELANEITTNADAETPYEKTEAITTWLDESKDYSVGETHEPDGDAIDDFLFEKDGGHSEHFAAATTEMLREEGVPARYVTGYTPGNAGDDGVYDVGSMDRHAWTEVYFEDEGWVRVDPTPTTERDAVQDAVRNGDRDATEYGVDERIIDAWSVGNPEVTGEPLDVDGVDEDTEIPPPPYDIDVEPTPEPGATVTVTVTKNGTAIPAADVQFNGDVVGTTAVDGTVDATVPYAESLTVSVTPPPSVDTSSESNTGGTQDSVSSPGTIGIPNGAFITAPVMLSSTDETSEDDFDTDTDESSERTYDLPTDVSVGTGEYVLPGETVTATFTINETVVPNAAVYVNNESVGETDVNGEIQLSIPTDAEHGDEITVRTERGDISSTTTLTVADVTVDIDAVYVPAPELPAEITVTIVTGEDEIEASNATVDVYTGEDVTGDAVATVETDENGTATTSLPWANTVSATGGVDGLTGTGVVTGLFYWAGAFGVLFAGIVLAAVYALRGHDVTVERVRGVLLTALFAVSDMVTRAGVVIYRSGNRAWVWGANVIASVRDGITRAKIRTAVKAVFFAPARAALLAYAKLKSILQKGVQRLHAIRGTDTSTSGFDEVEDVPDGIGSKSPYEKVLQAWRWLVRYTMGRFDASTKTAVEVGEKAEAKGLPSGAVRQLRRAFQDVEYGEIDAESRVDNAEAAVNNIRTETDGDMENQK